MTAEKTFQNYFIKTCNHAYRTSLTSGSGFTDTLVIGIDGYARFVELKILVLGKKGDKKLGSTFQLTQPAWYLSFLTGKGSRPHRGKNLFVAFQIGTKYGLLKVTKDFVMSVDALYYSDMKKMEEYKEFSSIKELVKEIEG